MNEIICFHNPNEENGWLSNWYSSDFEMDGIRFCMMEQYMMYQKAITFRDMVTAEKILNETDAACIKQYGREVANYNDVVWNGVRQIIVYNGLTAKFSQDRELCKKLKATGTATLAECAVHDRVWGIGISMMDSDRLDISKWKGQNLLGFTLMQVRDTNL